MCALHAQDTMKARLPRRAPDLTTWVPGLPQEISAEPAGPPGDPRCLARRVSGPSHLSQCTRARARSAALAKADG